MENTNTITVKDVFEQLVALQKDMCGNTGAALYRMGDALSAVFGDGTSLEDCEDVSAVVEQICKPFKMREATYQSMLALYEKMYDDCKNGVQ